ncbi:MAG: hypothetical protein KDD49_11870 [Bacteroidetes bacterium]|nr:hypothetical protein [Bacteroidota bacterium]
MEQQKNIRIKADEALVKKIQREEIWVALTIIVLSLLVLLMGILIYFREIDWKERIAWLSGLVLLYSFLFPVFISQRAKEYNSIVREIEILNEKEIIFRTFPHRILLLFKISSKEYHFRKDAYRITDVIFHAEKALSIKDRKGNDWIIYPDNFPPDIIEYLKEVKN